MPPAADGSPPPGDPGATFGRVVFERPGDAPSDLLGRLGFAAGASRPVIVVSGGADELVEPHLSVARQALGPALRAAVAATGAAVVDGGTAAGVMALVGAERAADPASIPVLVGVAPAGLVQQPGKPDAGATALEPHHTHVVLADSDEWGGETPLLTAIADELAYGEAVAMVVVGGGAGTLKEVEQAVARGWPLLVVEGTGGLADEIAAVRGGRATHEELRRALDGGDVTTAAPGAALDAALIERLRDAGILREAWQQFATYDALAVKLRRTFERQQVTAIVLGVVATALALFYDALRDAPEALRYLVIAVPISASVVIALANRRAAGKRWIALRAAAEAIKSEIYRFRTRTGVYSAGALRACEEPTTRRERLAGRLTEIESQLMATAASSGPLTPYDGQLPPVMYGAEAQDDGFKRLGSEDYVAMRVGDQLAYYRGKVKQMDRLRSILQPLTLVAGGVGTLLAAVGYEIWIGLTTAVAGGAVAHLGYMQVDNTVVAYNRAVAQLSALQRDFRAGGASRPDIEELVTRGEKILTTELGGWVEQMSEALEQLQAEQAEAAAKAEEQGGAKQAAAS